MRTAKRITTACLTAIMIFQALAPSTEVFAQELDAVMEASVSAARAAGNTARSVQDAVATALQDADQATSDDVATTPGADAGATEGGDGSTNAGESQDSTTDGTTNGDTPTEGDASQDDAAADEGAADEDQADDADTDAAAQASTDPAIKTWAQWGGVVPAGSLLKDTDSKVYRNVAGVPLTTPPSGMPGGPGPWTHLWAVITISAGGAAWATGVAYKVGDVVTYQSKTYKCAQAHSSQAGWDPVSVPALWTLQP